MKPQGLGSHKQREIRQGFPTAVAVYNSSCSRYMKTIQKTLYANVCLESTGLWETFSTSNSSQKTQTIRIKNVYENDTYFYLFVYICSVSTVGQFKTMFGNL